MLPVIDRGRCEGQSDCARVCPYGVFLVRKLETDEKAELGRLMRLRIWASRFAANMGDIAIDAFVQGHHSTHGALRNLGIGQHTPNTKAAGIGMALLQVIDLEHQG